MNTETKTMELLLKAEELFEAGDYVALLKIVVPEAQNGNQPFEHLMGVLYRDGLGVVQNYKTAIEWFEKSGAEIKEKCLI